MEQPYEDFKGDYEQKLRKEYRESDFDGEFYEFVRKKYKEEQDIIETRNSNFRPF